MEKVPDNLAYEIFDVVGGICECCRKRLTRSNRGRIGDGAWEAHHRFPERPITADNVKIVCTTGRNCHLYCCHNGNYQNYPTWPQICTRR